MVGGWGFRELHGGEGDAKFILNLSLVVLLVGVLQGLIRIYPPDTRALTVVRIERRLVYIHRYGTDRKRKLVHTDKYLLKEAELQASSLIRRSLQTSKET